MTQKNKCQTFIIHSSTVIDYMNDYIVFNAVSAIFQPYNGGHGYWKDQRDATVTILRHTTLCPKGLWEYIHNFPFSTMWKIRALDTQNMSISCWFHGWSCRFLISILIVIFGRWLYTHSSYAVAFFDLLIAGT